MPAAAESIASASELVVRYSSHTVLDGATLAIHDGDRIGMVGRNGCGKSTFLKIAAGESVADSGQFTRKRGLITGYLPQEFELDDDANVHDNVLSGAQFVIDLIKEYENTPADSQRSAELLDLINHHDGWDLEHRTQSLLSHLHAPEAGRIVGELSGGEKRRVALCRALLARPDFLILDEPTNHLDTESIEWLEQFLARYQGACLFVTHDRYFLDRIATRIVEIRRGQCDSYQGNYTDYLLSRAERDLAEARNEHKRQRFLSRELDWVRRRPKARTTKSRDRMDRYFEVANQDAPEQELDVDLIIPVPPKLGNKIIEAKDVSMAYDGKPALFTGLNLKLEEGHRLGIVGRNGMGKSTLINTLLGRLQPSSGTVEIGNKTEVNFIDQNRLLLDGNKSVFEEVGEGQETVRLGDETLGLRAYLRRFLFTEERINTKIDLLSGGERSRVMLAKILKQGGNVIVLDEPTNDLDLNTLRLLEEALAGFKGCVIAVSHDRYFLNRVCTDILAFEGNGVVHHQVGGYDYYLEKKQERDSRQTTQSNTSTKKQKAPRKERPRKLKWAEERELESMEETIMEAEEKVAKLEAAFDAPDFYEKHGDNWQELEQELKAAKAHVPELYQRWEELEAIRLAAEKT
ncbi:ABC-F family ATP-binding cassette domain-containing protein [Verrucomicrobiaceae bacterium N1E253]|uniref:ABC-F family ATP-binding cassette domain-containing protein n=1 Tax=Oceaniferula marina TaxID=2748318 RepID=A0A851GQU5_9BACT|nr:ABC-F family ATP-binding cassette domain-containing protein [Oceaniferula marina]NWK56554.1 ABC-F family ATP-binding cassette domain-containing protein [Oceaniferula marina]